MLLNTIYLETTIFGLPCLPAWLLASFGAFLLGWLLDWLLSSRRHSNLAKEWEEKYNKAHQRGITWEKELATMKYDFDELNKKYKATRNDLQICEADKQVLRTKLSNAEQNVALGATANHQEDGSANVALTALETKYNDLEANYKVLQTSLERCEADNLALTKQLNGDVASTNSPGASLSYGKIFSDDNLQIVEGIGPKIEDLLKSNGILTWSSLSEATSESLNEILEKGGSRFKMHDPGSWAQQAGFAANGAWDELVNYQHRLSGGMLVTGQSDNPAKVEKLAMKILGFSNNPEDLKIIEGIGPKIEKLLKGEGIMNWSDLAATQKETLKGILDKAGDRYRLADPTTWPKQADLAAKGLWNDLADYQDYLQGGKEPSK